MRAILWTLLLLSPLTFASQSEQNDGDSIQNEDQIIPANQLDQTASLSAVLQSQGVVQMLMELLGPEDSIFLFNNFRMPGNSYGRYIEIYPNNDNQQRTKKWLKLLKDNTTKLEDERLECALQMMKEPLYVETFEKFIQFYREAMGVRKLADESLNFMIQKSKAMIFEYRTFEILQAKLDPLEKSAGNVEIMYLTRKDESQARVLSKFFDLLYGNSDRTRTVEYMNNSYKIMQQTENYEGFEKEFMKWNVDFGQDVETAIDYTLNGYKYDLQKIEDWFNFFMKREPLDEQKHPEQWRRDPSAKKKAALKFAENMLNGDDFDFESFEKEYERLVDLGAYKEKEKVFLMTKLQFNYVQNPDFKKWVEFFEKTFGLQKTAKDLKVSILQSENMIANNDDFEKFEKKFHFLIEKHDISKDGFVNNDYIRRKIIRNAQNLDDEIFDFVSQTFLTNVEQKLFVSRTDLTDDQQKLKESLQRFLIYSASREHFNFEKLKATLEALKHFGEQNPSILTVEHMMEFDLETLKQWFDLYKTYHQDSKDEDSLEYAKYQFHKVDFQELKERIAIFENGFEKSFSDAAFDKAMETYHLDLEVLKQWFSLYKSSNIDSKQALQEAKNKMKDKVGFQKYNQRFNFFKNHLERTPSNAIKEADKNESDEDLQVLKQFFDFYKKNVHCWDDAKQLALYHVRTRERTNEGVVFGTLICKYDVEVKDPILKSSIKYSKCTNSYSLKSKSNTKIKLSGQKKFAERKTFSYKYK